MKVVKSEQQQDKILLTLELTPKQNEFISSVGIGVLIQQGALFFASDRVFEANQEAAKSETVEKDITPPEDASA